MTGPPLYLTTPTTPAIRRAMKQGFIGAVKTPYGSNHHTVNPIRDLPMWAADNGCFGTVYPGDREYLAWLKILQPWAGKCWFAVAPDVPFDMHASLARSRPFLEPIRELGYPVALAFQNGAESMEVPWEDFDVMFIGGDTAWKLSDHARLLAQGARDWGKPVHMGRVNSLTRLRTAWEFGCCTVDGTKIAYAPDEGLRDVIRWTKQLHEEAACAA